MKKLRPIAILSVLMVLLFGTAQPAAAATITITSGPPASPVTAYKTYPTHTFTASGGKAPYTLSLGPGALPPGLALSSASRTLSGTPTTPGSYSFGIRLTDANGDFAEQDVTVVVVAPTITITSGAPASPVTAYEKYPTHTFTASGGTGPYTLSLGAGALPPGLALSSVPRTLSGTPTTPGSYTFGIRLTDEHGFHAEQDVTVEVVAPTITITSGVPTSPWYTAQPYPTHTFKAAGGTAPYTLSLRSGALPPGMALASATGTLSGTPTTTGSYSFEIRLTDEHGFHADQDVTVVIAKPATTITSGAPPKGTVGEAYSFRFTATGDSNITFSVAAGDLPAGLDLAPGGVLSGTPDAEGSFTFTVKATGAATSAKAEVTIVIDAAPASPSPTPTVTSPAPGTPGPATPSAGSGLPVTGSNLATMLLLGVAAIAIGGMVLLALHVRRQRFTAGG
ncbi:Putative Ig domain-containing protein [Micromonospora viridifaciens]|uniref:Putative Ig domain-containing protein n=1 Tax=Micromonospora viridifaciens TaxID=1881 RepID=A0A1C4ZJ62_MICVI|nr:Ig domain-containing protein [Micromonospora viridifaciens]SCF33053.1 Putative Ig domain-containing protein [Micromonospora viridifaciens]